MFLRSSPEPANSRSTARQKLTRLTRQQFQELSTDVYDELIRRKNNSSDNEGSFPRTFSIFPSPLTLIFLCLQSLSYPYVTTFIRNGIKLVKSLQLFLPLVSRIFPVMFTTN